MEKKCLNCLSTFIGRSDKKFCTDQCRATYHNMNRSEDERIIKKVNSVLRKNRTILKMINPVGLSVVRKEYCIEKGFNFKYFTSIFTTSDGNIYHFCYDIGYMLLEENKIRIVEYQKNMKR